MKCEDLQFNLPLYTDDVLSGGERAALDAHLARCPVCRQKLADFQNLRQNLRVLARPEIPTHVLRSLKTAVAAQTQTATAKSAPPAPQFFVFTETAGKWIETRLLPYSVGALATFVLGTTFLWMILSAANRPDANAEIARNQTFSEKTVLLTDAESRSAVGEPDLTPTAYAATRLAVASESPSINPQGALVALTKSLMRGEMKDEEVVVVADVFGDGLAQIEEVVEPSGNVRAVYELEKALKTDSAYAPFVPADLDRRSDSVRVILKIQSVNVKTNLNSSSRR